MQIEKDVQVIDLINKLFEIGEKHHGAEVAWVYVLGSLHALLDIICKDSEFVQKIINKEYALKLKELDIK
jgi:hypothetical protein